jgi:cell filamentation protein
MNPYFDPATNTPYNLLGIKDPAKLEQFEYTVTAQRIRELVAKPVAGKFDLAHAQEIHRRLFDGIYVWAGQPRTLNMNKSAGAGWTSRFVDVDQMRALDKRMQADLAANKYLKGLTQPEFAERITRFYADLNYMHPFPEGNGRSAQVLLGQLAQQAGHALDYSKVSAAEWNAAAARATPQSHREAPALRRPGELQPMLDVFRAITTTQAQLGPTNTPSRGRSR